MIYFDYAATSKKRKYLLEQVLDNFDDFNGNPDSQHAYGRRAKKILEESRAKIASSINASPDEIIFTSSASESNNMVINNFDGEDIEIISSKIEHPSVLNTLSFTDSKVILIDANKDGLVSLDDIGSSITDKTKLISLMFVNNETGVIQDVNRVRDLIGHRDIWYHVDAVQAYGHIDIDVKEIGCDSLSLSGHKIGGLNGIGVLYLRKRLKSLIHGGNQEKKRRAGTSYVMGAYTMAESIAPCINERKKIRNIKSSLIKKLDEEAIVYEINGDVNISSDHILNLYLPFVKSDFLITYLDMNGICASTGSACTAGSLEPSHVLGNMYDSHRANHSIRFSFGFDNEIEELDQLVDILKELQERMLNEGK